MNQAGKVLGMSLVVAGMFSCAPTKMSNVDVSSSESVKESGLVDEGSPAPQPAPAPAPSPSLPPDITTGIPDIDREAGPVMEEIGKADPEFDASDVYLFRLSVVFNLFGKQVQKKYDGDPADCQLEAKWKFLILNKTSVRDLAESKCEGFQRARQVAAANGGVCTPQIGLQKEFKLGDIIHFDRTTELGADCKCFRRYNVKLLRGALLSHEVRAFAKTEVCQEEFPEYK